MSVNGVPAPLLFVSPNQINFQIPSTPGESNAAGIVVTTSGGQNAPFQLVPSSVPAPGIFTIDATGCGRGAVLNVAGNGTVSVNSPTNSAAPGSFISIFGTGNGAVSNAPTDGVPASANPLAVSVGGASPLFDFSAGGDEGRVFWAGRAPGLVGVDQFNFVVPSAAREGCAVPLQILNENISAPVVISIAKSGGRCSDPPAQSYGEITWEKTTIIATDGSGTTTETATVSLQSSPGRKVPTQITYMEGSTLPGAYKYFGASCPVPGYRSLDAGAVTAEAPGIPAVPAVRTPLPAATVLNVQPQGGFTLVSQVQSGQAAGMTIYKATLPSGTIRSGSFTVSATGGADLPAFQSTVQIGTPIQVITALAGRVLHSNGPPLQIQWTGGDPNEWVTVKLVGHFGSFDHYPSAWVARASDGQITISGVPGSTGFGIAGPVELVIEVVPDPSQIPSLTAPNLSLGGKVQWKHIYRFEGVLAEQ